MAKVYAKHQGAEIRIGNFGIVTAEIAVEVPEAVAVELASAPDLRVVIEQEEPAARRHRVRPAEPAEPAKE